MIFRLTKDLVFPDPNLADEDGLLAIDGDLSPERLILAYQNGIFPWFNEDSPILWYSPKERFVLFPSEIKISKSMRQLINAKKFNITHNKAFKEVIMACADFKRINQDGTWITKEMQQAYIKLNDLGFAHSIEVWEGKDLIGGLYGVLINQVFCGESMFSKKSNTSKLALIGLCENANIKLIDCQIQSDHLETLGAKMIERELFTNYLKP
ncbi:leucyl/phenylalanyl-tRNA--protein transferase [Pedobacter psychrophilus]|uniref:Leucyl/phenylalanyl-tRNA--protein transferase n=1 Tax=Pedobacter psychrophilus TaxID=1826909 RepID=A0A179DC79_9SPHI|nr:leucyl/phenylalanyl-tRNA--protein transferase [Pedobacter psychrophilus]OAQ38655.1 leucyl/phenylalanyl-tRNA--protein transferase [Pedobacter psychrophilus]